MASSPLGFPSVALRSELKGRKPSAARLAVCRAQDREEANGIRRRDALVGGGLLVTGGVVAAPEVAQAAGLKVTLKKEDLTSRQVKELRDAVIERSEKILSTVLTAADNPDALRLLINDAGTYDIAAKTGGVDGSIILEEELNRPENAPLKPYVEKLRGAKKTIDEESAKVGQEEISWADLIVLAAKVTTQLDWFNDKLKTTGGDAENATLITKAYGTSFGVSIGRTDATTPSPAGTIPPPDASIADILEFMRKLANKTPDEEPGYFSPKPPFGPKQAFVLYTASCSDPAKAEDEWVAAFPEKLGDIKKDYDKSRRTVTRTNYEVDFVDFFTKLSNVGAKYDNLKYLIDLDVELKG